MKSYSFENLKVCQKSKQWIVHIYDITDDFPAEEGYGLTSQLRRASVSISSNIAEGSSRKTPKDQNRFYVMAYSSGIEVLNQLLIAEALNYVSNEQIQKSRIKISEILAMLDALTKSLKL